MLNFVAMTTKIRDFCQNAEGKNENSNFCPRDGNQGENSWQKDDRNL